jgi:hypothetical protein
VISSWRKRLLLIDAQLPNNQLTPDAQKRMEKMKGILDKFNKKIQTKFEDYIMGVSLLPPAKEEKEKDKINVLVLMDDSDSTKMTKAGVTTKAPEAG